MQRRAAGMRWTALNAFSRACAGIGKSSVYGTGRSSGNRGSFAVLRSSGNGDVDAEDCRNGGEGSLGGQEAAIMNRSEGLEGRSLSYHAPGHLPQRGDAGGGHVVGEVLAHKRAASFMGIHEMLEDAIAADFRAAPDTAARERAEVHVVCVRACVHACTRVCACINTVGLRWSPLPPSVRPSCNLHSCSGELSCNLHSHVLLSLLLLTVASCHLLPLTPP